MEEVEEEEDVDKKFSYKKISQENLINIKFSKIKKMKLI
jgi:hypothetical protein